MEAAPGDVRFRRVHHVQIAAPSGSEETARRFYGDVLGLTAISKPAHLAVRGGTWFRAGDQEIHIGVEPDFRASTKPHTAFEVVGLDALRRRLEEHGVRTWEDLPLPGYRRFYAADPFGNRLEFDERAGDSATASE
jgi:catechol 2,3-dioxygenase-like lactoylglutathione lyase family enzyme